MAKVIYRVEDADGKGPYVRWSGQMAWQDQPHSDLQRAPAPYNDGIANYSSGYYGFKTKRDLLRWFTRSERRKMAGLGYVVNVYSRPLETVFGDHQVMFQKKKAARLTQLRLPDLKPVSKETKEAT